MILDQILQGDALGQLAALPAESVDCCITSPPYYGLRDYGMAGQIGLEQTPEEYVAKLVDVFREVRRVLKPEGTLWLNLGDSYATNGGSRSYGSYDDSVGRGDAIAGNRKAPTGLKSKDLIGIPWMVAFALRTDGWYLRSDIIWHKPNCMPESVTDRPTKAHEYLFLLSKSKKYYYDAVAVKEPTTGNAHARGNGTHPKTVDPGLGIKANGSFESACRNIVLSRNKRSVWSVNSQPYKGTHFATFPEKLIEPCILAGTSERGYCQECGKPWARQVKKDSITPLDYEGKNRSQDPQFSGRRLLANVKARRMAGNEHDNPFPPKETIGWLPSCSCGLDSIPGIALDPFSGAGTVALVAKKLGRHYIGIELNPDYIQMSLSRIAKVPTPLTTFQ